MDGNVHHATTTTPEGLPDTAAIAHTIRKPRPDSRDARGGAMSRVTARAVSPSKSMASRRRVRYGRLTSPRWPHPARPRPPRPASCLRVGPYADPRPGLARKRPRPAPRRAGCPAPRTPRRRLGLPRLLLHLDRLVHGLDGDVRGLGGFTGIRGGCSRNRRPGPRTWWPTRRPRRTFPRGRPHCLGLMCSRCLPAPREPYTKTHAQVAMEGAA